MGSKKNAAAPAAAPPKAVAVKTPQELLAEFNKALKIWHTCGYTAEMQKAWVEIHKAKAACAAAGVETPKITTFPS